MSTVSPPFSAVEQVPPRLAIDLDRLEGFARDHAEGLEAPVAAWKFRGGQSNPTYALLGADGGRFVLRRKPPGRLIPGAHAVDREFRKLLARCISHDLSNNLRNGPSLSRSSAKLFFEILFQDMLRILLG